MSSVVADPKPIQLDSASEVFYNLSVAQLIEHAIRNGEGELASNGALTARTGKYTGRTPKDKFIVKDALTEGKVWWGGNNAMTPDTFAHLEKRAGDFIAGKRLYVVDTCGGADPVHQIKVRFIVQRAWHALFVKQLLIRPTEDELKNFEPDWTIVDVCEMITDPVADGVRGDATIALKFFGT